MTEDDLERAALWLNVAKRVCVLTGAGVSAESGVPTFRASDGLWEGHRVEDVASPGGWERDPALVWNFYNERRANVAKVKPNPGHHAARGTGKALGRSLHTGYAERGWVAPGCRQQERAGDSREPAPDALPRVRRDHRPRHGSTRRRTRMPAVPRPIAPAHRLVRRRSR